MADGPSTRLNEVDFCAHMTALLQPIFDARPDGAFTEARIEGYAQKGKGHASKRKDFRFLGRAGKPVITGEVKLPGTLEGRSPFADELVRDAQEKADHAGARWFFTWNVNTFVLWDRQRWDKPLLERRVAVWDLDLALKNAADVDRASTTENLRTKFLPKLIAELDDIVQGRGETRWLAPDDLFITSIHSHIAWPVTITSDWLESETGRPNNKKFDTKLQQWMTEMAWSFVREQPDDWREALHRASSSLAYVLINRVIFYKALRDRFEDLPQLKLPSSITDADKAFEYLQKRFQMAVDRTGDYEPLLYPDVDDWASTLTFAGGKAIDAWRSVLSAVESYDFKNIASDVVGKIFQRLIGPEERHRFGQHFTTDDPADLINAFCIRSADATVLDPACGSGSFLVRAYYRKKTKDPSRTHEQIIAELFGCDISLFPAHLATLNLAAREIKDEANYPRIARRDFFGVEPDEPFCYIPAAGTNTAEPVLLPVLDAVVGNPPYIDQRRFKKAEKADMLSVGRRNFPDLNISPKSDVHCYFWPAAARLLAPNGWFGFITSSYWLDVQYGFGLQGWILANFRLIAVLESTAEPWFTDARVKTCITILKRETNEVVRATNLVKFVQLHKPLSEIFGVPAGAEEHSRQRAVDTVRNFIESQNEDYSDERMRIIVKVQGDLWREGCAIVAEEPTSDDDDDTEGESGGVPEEWFEGSPTTGYVAGKWGRYLRAPDLYFEIMRDYGTKFVKLGSVVDVRRGITSGCDAFFMPVDDTASALSQITSPKEFKSDFGVDRQLVESGAVRIIRDGAGVRFPIEAQFLVPVVHSIQELDRPSVSPKQLNHVVLLVSAPLSALRGTLVAKYLKYGESAIYASTKSASVPVPQRPSVAARQPWYDLSKLVRPGFAMWPKVTQYRPLVLWNPTGFVTRNRLYDLSIPTGQTVDTEVLTAILNSSLVALWRCFYSRWIGMEGALESASVDVRLCDIPSLELVTPTLLSRIKAAFAKLRARLAGEFVEDALRECGDPERAKQVAAGPLVLPGELQQPDRQELDDTVLELIGITDPAQRREMRNRLYQAISLHFRQVRVVEIIKQEQRAASKTRKFGTAELAADVWDSASQKFNDLRPARDWLVAEFSGGLVIQLPEGAPRLKPRNDQFEATIVFFGKDPKNHLKLPTRAHAELVELLAGYGVQGEVELPKDKVDTEKALGVLRERLKGARLVMDELAGSRAGNEETKQEVLAVVMRWFVSGKPQRQ